MTQIGWCYYLQTIHRLQRTGKITLEKEKFLEVKSVGFKKKFGEDAYLRRTSCELKQTKQSGEHTPAV